MTHQPPSSKTWCGHDINNFVSLSQPLGRDPIFLANVVTCLFKNLKVFLFFIFRLVKIYFSLFCWQSNATQLWENWSNSSSQPSFLIQKHPFTCNCVWAGHWKGLQAFINKLRIEEMSSATPQPSTMATTQRDWHTHTMSKWKQHGT